jgi:LysM repeat protein
MGELVKFLLLVVILVGTILVVGFLRPLIFGRIVPAVLGAHITFTPTAVPVGEPAATVTPQATTLATPITPTIPAPPTPPPPSPTAELITYTVQPGDNLVDIAQRFGVTIAALRQANPHITNPNYITVGTVLVIPNP